MSAALVAPSPDAAESRKRRFQSGDCAEEVLPKRRYAEARRLLDWVAHLCQRYPAMTDKVRAPSGGPARASALTLAPTQEITHVLDSCGGDVEATIRRLDELSLSMAARDAGRAAGGGAGPGGGPQADGAPCPLDCSGTPRRCAGRAPHCFARGWRAPCAARAAPRLRGFAER